MERSEIKWLMLGTRFLKIKNKRMLASRSLCSLAVIIAVSVLIFNTADCFADQSETAIAVDIQINGTTTNIANYTSEELRTMPQSQIVYSSVNAYDAPSLVIAKGITLTDLFDELGVDLVDISEITLSSSDGRLSKYNSEDYLNKPRYYFSGIFNGEEGKSEVVPLLALEKHEERTAVEPDLSEMSNAEGISFCFGQNEITDKVSIKYGKYINKIALVLKDGTSFEIPKEPYGAGTKTDNEQTGSQNGEGQAASTGAIGQVPAAEEDIDQGLTADTLTITVGYYGGPYSVKKVFTLDELYKMALVDQVYSYIDNMPAVVLESARGVRLTDLLKAAGIDVNSVESFHFFCSDVKTSWYQSINKEYLMDTIRYYYPDLQKSWNYDESAAGADATEGEEEVDTIIALEDNWKRFATEPNFTELVKKSRFRLVFGQTDTTTKNAYRSARWIHTIEVMLGGKPPETQEKEKTLLSTEVGSKLSHDDGVGNATEVNTAGVQNWRVYEMSKSAEELQAAESDNPLLPLIAFMAVLILFVGITFGIVRFYREV